jgi:GMP synthase (glutamine-hydrolysing)
MILVLDNEIDPEHRYLGEEIARRIPESTYRVYVEEPRPLAGDVDGVVLAGSTAGVYEDGHDDWLDPERELIRQCVREEVPLLGVCFGHQLVNEALGGTVEPTGTKRATYVEMTDWDRDDPVIGRSGPVVPVIHGDVVVERGDEMEVIGETAYDPNFCTRHETAPVWTVQFHPEFRPAFADHLSSWTDGDHTFEESAAGRVLDDFADFCLDA